MDKVMMLEKINYVKKIGMQTIQWQYIKEKNIDTWLFHKFLHNNLDKFAAWMNNLACS